MTDLDTKLTKITDKLSKSQYEANAQLFQNTDDIKQLKLLSKKKLSTEDGARIWRHFYRFAEYDDLKDLYNRCIPQIAKFEEKLIL